MCVLEFPIWCSGGSLTLSPLEGIRACPRGPEANIPKRHCTSSRTWPGLGELPPQPWDVSRPEAFLLPQTLQPGSTQVCWPGGRAFVTR